MVETPSREARQETGSGLVAPFLWDDIPNVPDWRDRIVWPVSAAYSRAMGEAVCREVIDRTAAIGDEFDQQIAKVAAGRFVNEFVSLTEAAFIAQSEARSGIQALGGPPELDAMRDGGAPASVLSSTHRGKGIMDVTPSNHALLRSVARTTSWTPFPMLPSALVIPHKIAVSHNMLLRRYARLKRVSARYWPAANMLANARARGQGFADNDSGRALIGAMGAALLPHAETLAEPWRSRVLSLFEARLKPAIARVGADVLALRETRRLPENLWCGTGAAYAARVIASEVRRRGGTVTSFDHGGATGISQLLQLTTISELMISTHFCVGTKSWADIVSSSEAVTLAAPFGGCKIIHSDGEPTFRQACIDGIARTRRRVVYVGHPYRALRQFAIAGTSDVIYWDLQSRVAAQLNEMPVDLICKPHPEGHFVGGRNPIEKIATTSYRRFEEHLPDTDVFVFDAPTSTTFAEALCTNRPVVLIERGQYPFNPVIDAEVRSRCRIVPSRIDERNRIWPDLKALEEAVSGGSDTSDPSFFRALFAGVS